MAKKEKNSSSHGGNAVYVVAGIVFALAMAVSITFFVLINSIKDQTMNITMTSVNSIYTIKTELVSVNRNILMIVSNTGNLQSHISSIENSFSVIKENEATFESIMLDKNSRGYNEAEAARYKQAKLYIDALDQELLEYQKSLAGGAISLTEAKTVYEQELAPYQTTALEMFDAVIDISTAQSAINRAQSARIYNLILGVMIALVVLGEVGIIAASRIAKRQREEVEKQERQAAAADIKFRHSQEKINEVAFTNILTGLKNRYALEEDIGEKLDDESFNIAAFDIDNFRSINDIYGYDFGDEYLIQIADTLKEKFSAYGEIYNITGNEFVFVYNKEATEFQIQKYNQDVFNALSAVYNVANIGVQLTVSGSTYHYLAGDCMNLSAVLVRMDNAIRNAKRGGGNTIVPVQGV